MRYFFRIAYNGTRYHGWQRQPEGITVQSDLEDSMSTILREKIEILGCGRTDAKVHASDYFFHVDTEKPIIDNGFQRRLNGFLGKDLVVKEIIPVHEDAHARFDATERGYEYVLKREKQPFNQETAYYFPFYDQLNFEKMNSFSSKLIGTKDFTTFCKTNSDANHMRCTMFKAEWIFDKDTAVFHIHANRFLRGMVRLIVGANLNLGIGKIEEQTILNCLEQKEFSPKSYSVPGHGLFLNKIVYPYIEE